MKEIKIKAWMARDKNNSAGRDMWLYSQKPGKGNHAYFNRASDLSFASVILREDLSKFKVLKPGELKRVEIIIREAK